MATISLMCSTFRRNESNSPDDDVLVGHEMFGELGQISRHVFAPGVIGEECSKIMRVFLQQDHHSGRDWMSWTS